MRINFRPFGERKFDECRLVVKSERPPTSACVCALANMQFSDIKSFLLSFQGTLERCPLTGLRSTICATETEEKTNYCIQARRHLCADVAVKFAVEWRNIGVHMVEYHASRESLYAQYSDVFPESHLDKMVSILDFLVHTSGHERLVQHVSAMHAAYDSIYAKWFQAQRHARMGDEAVSSVSVRASAFYERVVRDGLTSDAGQELAFAQSFLDAAIEYHREETATLHEFQGAVEVFVCLLHAAKKYMS
jgi:hypothetical protein